MTVVVAGDAVVVDEVVVRHERAAQVAVSEVDTGIEDGDDGRRRAS
jgi:hypothetical protein